MARKNLRLAIKILLLTGIIALAACVQEGTTPADDGTFHTNQGAPGATEPPVEEGPELWPLEGTIFEALYNNPVVLLQLQPLVPGEELAILHTNMGDITLRFFPEEAPMAVENFTTHARNGFYDGVIFHRVIPNFMIQGGCPYGQGFGGQSIWGGTFETEISFNLRHFRGALAKAHAGPGTIGSQFYIVQNENISRDFLLEFEATLRQLDMPIGVFPDGTRLYLGDVQSAQELEHFINYGGTPHLDWLFHQNPAAAHTVFGHVVDGMEVVDAIANAAAVSSRPVEDVIINSISFVIYGQ